MTNDDFFRERVKDIVLDVLEPFHKENRTSISRLGEQVVALRLAFARWAGGMSVLLVLLVLVEAMIAGGCFGHRSLTFNASEAKTTTAVDPTIP